MKVGSLQVWNQKAGSLYLLEPPGFTHQAASDNYPANWGFCGKKKKTNQTCSQTLPSCVIYKLTSLGTLDRGHIFTLLQPTGLTCHLDPLQALQSQYDQWP